MKHKQPQEGGTPNRHQPSCLPGTNHFAALVWSLAMLEGEHSMEGANKILSDFFGCCTGGIGAGVSPANFFGWRDKRLGRGCSSSFFWGSLKSCFVFRWFWKTLTWWFFGGKSWGNHWAEICEDSWTFFVNPKYTTLLGSWKWVGGLSTNQLGVPLVFLRKLKSSKPYFSGKT